MHEGLSREGLSREGLSREGLSREGLRIVNPAPGLTVAVTNRTSGDFGVGAAGVDQRRRAVVGGLPISWLSQVHGSMVVEVGGAERGKSECGRPEVEGAEDEAAQLEGPDADAAVTRSVGLALSVVTADCAPIALWSEAGVIGVVHAGWRGLLDGVVERTVETIRRDRGDTAIHALVGPCIHPECYEFGTDDLDEIAGVYGDGVRGTTTWGTSALDLPAAVSAALTGVGVRAWNGPGADAFKACTACDDRWFSWRARKDTGRQALLAWRTA